MQQSVEMVQSLAAEGNITLCIESASLQVWADGDRIIQALVNLVSNAIKFSPPETTVTLSVQDQADRGRRAAMLAAKNSVFPRRFESFHGVANGSNEWSNQARIS